MDSFGVQGKDPGQLDFPNDVAVDKKGNYYVADGNNARISSWGPDFKYRSFFGFGSNVESLNLPRGLWIDNRDRLHVADAVGSVIRVYDVSGDVPKFLGTFGAYGSTEGAFRFPNDITIDGTGRLYIADRENNRIQVWSY
jgi:sugar lactone lactonase YvrE